VTIQSFEIPVEAIYGLGIAAYLAIAVFFGGLLTRLDNQNLSGTWVGSIVVFLALLWPGVIVLWLMAGAFALLCHALDVYF
jgi:putative effector of murein hydrolase LrgA (UPF0299 family)